MKGFLYFLLLFAGVISSAQAIIDRENTVSARIGEKYVVVKMSDGGKSLIPVDSLTPSDLAFLQELSLESPLEKGQSSVKVAKTAKTKVRETILKKERVGAVETVQLISPNIMRDQIGGTCMLYARVHWLDIAGYYIDTPEIYKIINHCPPNEPWANPLYYQYLDYMVRSPQPTPIIHRVPVGVNDFDWAREQLRQGRPLLAALPFEIWRALPAEFLGQRPWSGGNVGHQIVINGFTYNHDTGEGSFHVVNTWKELPEFDFDLQFTKGGALIIEASLSPMGQKLAQPPRRLAASSPLEVLSVRLIRKAGTVNLYEVQTTHGVKKVAAANEAAAKEAALAD